MPKRCEPDSAHEHHRRHRHRLLGSLTGPLRRIRETAAPFLKKRATAATATPVHAPAPDPEPPAPVVLDYATWVTRLAPGDEVAVANSHHRLTQITRIESIDHARIKLVDIPTLFWRVEPYIGFASGLPVVDDRGVVPHKCIVPVTPAHREWASTRPSIP